MNKSRRNRRTRIVKVLILGDSGVGKSSVMTQFVKDTFSKEIVSTVGTEFLTKVVTYDDTHFTLQIWDTAGQERFRSLRNSFYRGADVALIAFAVNDRNSFLHLDSWCSEFFDHVDLPVEQFPVIVLGNKIDLPMEQHTVRKEEVFSWCKKNGNWPYIETSAKDATNINKAFEICIRQWNVFEKDQDSYFSSDSFSLHYNPQKRHRCCS